VEVAKACAGPGDVRKRLGVGLLRRGCGAAGALAASAAPPASAASAATSVIPLPDSCHWSGLLFLEYCCHGSATVAATAVVGPESVRSFSQLFNGRGTIFREHDT
jgi:hypothetical protein